MTASKTAAALIWETIKAHPGISSGGVAERLAPEIEAGRLTKQTIYAATSAMRDAGGLRDVGVTEGGAGKTAKTFEVVGDAPPAQRRPPQKHEAKQPDVARTSSAMQRTWEAVKANPGATSNDLLLVAERFGLAPKRNTVTANLSLLKSNGLITSTKAIDPARPQYTMQSYRAVGESYPERRKQQRRKRADAMRAPDALRDLGEAMLAPPAPMVASRSKGVKTRWSFEEAEAICRVWAAKHLSRGAKLSEQGLMEIARLGGAGFRARPKITAQSARQFLREHEAMLRAFIEAFKFEPPPEEAEPAAHAAPQRDDDPVHQEDDEDESEEVAADPLSPAVEKAIQRFHAKLGEAPPPAAATPQSLGGLIGQALEHIIQSALAAEMDSLHKHMTQHLEGYSDRITQALGEALRGLHAPSLPQSFEQAARIIQPKAQPAPRLPKVIVVNALGAQFDSVKRAYPKGIDLRLVQDRMPGETDADLVISMTKFIGHPLDRALRKQFGERYCPVNGGADSVKLAIRNRLNLPMAG